MPMKALVQQVADRPEVAGAALLSPDGLVIEPILSDTATSDAEALAALAATVTRHGAELGERAGLGNVGTTVIECDRGAIIVTPITADVRLLVLARPDADLGELLYRLHQQRAGLAAAL